MTETYPAKEKEAINFTDGLKTYTQVWYDVETKLLTSYD
jgi:hypothetical protein